MIHLFIFSSLSLSSQWSTLWVTNAWPCNQSEHNQDSLSLIQTSSINFCHTASLSFGLKCWNADSSTGSGINEIYQEDIKRIKSQTCIKCHHCTNCSQIVQFEFMLYTSVYGMSMHNRTHHLQIHTVGEISIWSTVEFVSLLSYKEMNTLGFLWWINFNGGR